MRSISTSLRRQLQGQALSLWVFVWIAAGTARLPAQSAADTATDLTGPTTVSGQVVNSGTGLPVSRALVRFNDRAMLTGHDGKFEFDQVTESAGSLQVIKPGFYSSIDPGAATALLHTGQITAPLQLRLYPEAVFTGTVVAPDGDPLAHIIVSARRSVYDESGHRWTPEAQTQTDSHGRFRLPVPAGDYRLESMYMPKNRQTNEAVLPVQAPAQSSSGTSDLLHIRSGEQQSFDLHPAVSRSYTVTANFDSVMGRGFPRITARSGTGAAITLPVNFSRTAASGETRMELPSGTYTLTASILSPEGTEYGETTVTVTDHDISGVVFHLAPVPALPVELRAEAQAVSDDPQPGIQQFGLMLENDAPDSDIFNSTIHPVTGRDRSVIFTVPPGSYRLRARNHGAWYIRSASYGGSDLLQQDLTIGPGVGGTPIIITVSDQTANLQGTCRLSGVPANCWIYLIPSTPSAESVFALQSGAQGVYTYAHLPPGTYQAIAFEQRHSADYRDPATLTPFATHVRTLTVNAGEKPVLDLDAVSAAEIAP